jgi:hypothetical protein
MNHYEKGITESKPVLPNEIEHYHQNLMHQFCLIYHFGNKTKNKTKSNKFPPMHVLNEVCKNRKQDELAERNEN